MNDEILNQVFVDIQNCEASKTKNDDFGRGKMMTRRINVIAVWPEILRHCTGGGGASGAVISGGWWSWQPRR